MTSSPGGTSFAASKIEDLARPLVRTHPDGAQHMRLIDRRSAWPGITSNNALPALFWPNVAVPRLGRLLTALRVYFMDFPRCSEDVIPANQPLAVWLRLAISAPAFMIWCGPNEVYAGEGRELDHDE